MTDNQKPENIHGENCQDEHEHEEDKSMKGEKKVRKALGKLGMTKIDGVNRVTLRQKDNYVLLVKDPEVYTSSQTENTFIIFGELSIDDPDRKMARDEIEKMKHEGERIAPQTQVTQKETVEVVEEGEEVSEEGIDQASIDTVMSEGNCSRQRAVRALRDTNNDAILAILKVLG